MKGIKQIKLGEKRRIKLVLTDLETSLDFHCQRGKSQGFHGTTEPLRKGYTSWHFRVTDIIVGPSSHQPAVKLFSV